jgi:hypothetical protein
MKQMKKVSQQPSRQFSTACELLEYALKKSRGVECFDHRHIISMSPTGQKSIGLGFYVIENGFEMIDSFKLNDEQWQSINTLSLNLSTRHLVEVLEQLSCGEIAEAVWQFNMLGNSSIEQQESAYNRAEVAADELGDVAHLEGEAWFDAMCRLVDLLKEYQL